MIDWKFGILFPYSHEFRIEFQYINNFKKIANLESGYFEEG